MKENNPLNDKLGEAPRTPLGWVQRVKHVTGLDRAIGFTVLARGWQSFAGLITIALIAHFLSPAEQGYYFTFGSLVALQVLFELGFSYVILQMASHETAHLTIGEDGSVEGDLSHHARLASVLQKAMRWYAVASMLMMAALIPAGIYFFASHPHPGPQVAWLFPWCLVVVVNSMTFQIDPIFSFLEGSGHVPQVARTRLLQAVLGGCLAWTALVVHQGLFAPAMYILGQALAGSILLYQRRALLIGLFRHPVGQHGIRWGKEVWHFQWRIAVSWLCGYFIFSLFNPILFAFWGPVVAGQMGMSLTICNALLQISMAWITTKAAPFGMMISRKEYDKLDRVFFRALAQSLVIGVVGAVVGIVAVHYVELRHLEIGHRIVDSRTFAILLAAILANIAVFAEAGYLRAHKQEKFLLNSILTGVFMALSTYILGKKFGPIGMASGYLAVNVVIGLGLGTFTFLHYREKWHSG